MALSCLSDCLAGVYKFLFFRRSFFESSIFLRLSLGASAHNGGDHSRSGETRGQGSIYQGTGVLAFSRWCGAMLWLACIGVSPES